MGVIVVTDISSAYPNFDFGRQWGYMLGVVIFAFLTILPLIGTAITIIDLLREHGRGRHGQSL